METDIAIKDEIPLDIEDMSLAEGVQYKFLEDDSNAEDVKFEYVDFAQNDNIGDDCNIPMKSTISTTKPTKKRERCTKKTTSVQFELLLKELVKSPELAKNTHINNYKKEELWDNISNVLNAHGPPIRSVTEWKKVWADLKLRTKRKVLEYKPKKGILYTSVLNEYDQTICKILQNSVNKPRNIAKFGSSIISMPPQRKKVKQSTSTEPVSEKSQPHAGQTLGDTRGEVEQTPSIVSQAPALRRKFGFRSKDKHTNSILPVPGRAPPHAGQALGFTVDEVEQTTAAVQLPVPTTEFGAPLNEGPSISTTALSASPYHRRSFGLTLTSEKQPITSTITHSVSRQLLKTNSSTRTIPSFVQKNNSPTRQSPVSVTPMETVAIEKASTCSPSLPQSPSLSPIQLPTPSSTRSPSPACLRSRSSSPLPSFPSSLCSKRQFKTQSNNHTLLRQQIKNQGDFLKLSEKISDSFQHIFLKQAEIAERQAAAIERQTAAIERQAAAIGKQAIAMEAVVKILKDKVGSI